MGFFKNWCWENRKNMNLHIYLPPFTKVYSEGIIHLGVKFKASRIPENSGRDREVTVCR